MTEVKTKILQMFRRGLRAKEISEKTDIKYALVRRIVKQEQLRQRREKNPQPYRDKANSRYPRYAEKTIARSKKRYAEKHDEISNKTKEDRKKNPEKYRLKHQKEKLKDPERFKEKKNANWAKNYPKNKDRLNIKAKENRKSRKLTVVEHYSSGKLNCNCCGIKGIEFLTIDHIMPKKEMDRDKAMKEIGYRSTRKADPLCQWLITNNFPIGFQILCWNCNVAKGILGKCPHQK